MPLRIVIDARHIQGFGVGTYIRNLVRGLARVDAENRYVLIARRADLHELPQLPEQFETVVYDRLDSDPLDHALFPLFLRNLPADVFHIPLSPVPLLMPRPYVVTVHDMSSLLYQERSGWREDLLLLHFRRGLLRAGRIIAVSEATRRDVGSLLNIPVGRIQLIYNAPDPRFAELRAADRPDADSGQMPEERRRLLERYQIHHPFLLYTGTIRPQKNIPRLVEAFACLKSDLDDHPVYRDLRLIIIGDEISRYPALRRTVIQTRVEQAVRFLGFVPFDTLRLFYEAASAFVFPSLYEGFGLPPLEAMASGTPVVASNVSSLPEVVGDAAVIVNPENVFDIARGIREVLLDEDLRRRLVERGFEQVKRFSWERTAREVLEVYRQVAAPGVRRRAG